MAQPKIQNEPASTEGFEHSNEPPAEESEESLIRALVDGELVPFDQMTDDEKGDLADAIDGLKIRAQDLVDSGEAEDLGQAAEMIRDVLTESLSAAERRALRGPKGVKPRLRRDLFGSAGGIQ